LANATAFVLAATLKWMRLEGDRRPGRHPLHDQGYYYCLDFSSVFAASLMQAIAEPD
jgi:16S rRNA C967 or C1407 C5-methylase (RsmB/RsmF family)